MYHFRRRLSRSIRHRLNLVLFVALLSVGCCVCGGLTAFVIAPGQAIKASRIARMPMMDAEAVRVAAAGDPILITGTLAGNSPLRNDGELVAYREERWLVTLPSSDSSQTDPSGRWETGDTLIPNLNLTLNDQVIALLASAEAQLSGPLHENLVLSDSTLRASHEGESLPDGSQRFSGLADGDVITVWGQKASTGGVIPEQLYRGDRVSFEAEQRNSASALFYSGLCAMLFSPLILLGGGAYVFFGRERS